MIIAFSASECLLNKQNKPRVEIIELLKALSKNNKIIVWSDGGIDYARRIVNRLGIGRWVNQTAVKTKGIADITFDDEEITLGKHNIKI